MRMPPVSDDITLWTAKMTALACSAVAAFYAAAQLEPVGVVALCLSFAPLATVILWLQKDSHRTGVGPLLDFGFFLWFAWPVVIPWYAWKTRGRAGWRLTMGLIGLIVSAAIVAWLIYGLRYAIWYFGTDPSARGRK